MSLFEISHVKWVNFWKGDPQGQPRGQRGAAAPARVQPRADPEAGRRTGRCMGRGGTLFWFITRLVLGDRSMLML